MNLDLIEPAPIEYSFNTLGWQMFVIVMAISLLLMMVGKIISFRKNKYRRIAISQLNHLEKQNISLQQLVSQFNNTLKSIAIHKFGRSHIAPLSGNDWLNFLNSKTKNPQFDNETFAIIQLGIFNAEVLNQSIFRAFAGQTKNWIRKHDV